MLFGDIFTRVELQLQSVCAVVLFNELKGGGFPLRLGRYREVQQGTFRLVYRLPITGHGQARGSSSKLSEACLSAQNTAWACNIRGPDIGQVDFREANNDPS